MVNEIQLECGEEIFAYELEATEVAHPAKIATCTRAVAVDKST